MSYLSRNDIEQIAARVTSDYKCLPRFQGQVVEHIDPEILACELCGLHLDYFHLSRDGLTLGMTSDGRVEVPVIGEDGELILFFLDGATILIEKDLKNAPEQRGRYNFTLMHETSHQILYRLVEHERPIHRECHEYQTEAPQELVLTLCPTCLSQFICSPDHIVKRLDRSQKKEPCVYCSVRRGYDYRIFHKKKRFGDDRY